MHDQAGRRMLYCLNRIADTLTIQGWERWHEVYAYEDWCAATMLRCLDRMIHKELGVAWNKWQSSKHYTTMRHALISLRRWAKRTALLRLSHGWHAWWRVVMVLRFQHQTMRVAKGQAERAFGKVLCRWGDLQALAAWNKWCALIPS